VLEITPLLRSIPAGPQFAMLVPYVLTMMAVWWVLFPAERRVRDPLARGTQWTRWQFVQFNLRHHILIVAVPLSFLMLAYFVTRQYRQAINAFVGFPWAHDLAMGVAAVLIFSFSPMMLRYIWETTPLPPGELRTKLLSVCDRINLRIREILVWHSDGVMVNAAVMGIFPRLRYILLTDALIENMTDEQIEAVFGHEAGHVRHHHLQYFLLLALVSMLVMSGMMELLIWWVRSAGGPALSAEVIEIIAFASVLPIWGLAFGWVSRRFERQADVFGAGCAAPVKPNGSCRRPCCVHGDGTAATAQPAKKATQVCATGADTFVSALRKVATLNGIPPDERSWRHSSIASRIHFLTTQAADPTISRRFARTVSRIKLTLAGLCIVGLIGASAYVWQKPAYRRQIQRDILSPLQSLFE